MGLQFLCKDLKQTHIHIRSDNSTAVACLDRHGSTKLDLNLLTEEIFSWCESRGITLTAEHVKGIHNVKADQESRIKNFDTEWMLRPHIFKRLCQIFGTPDIDLFASRINAQVKTYVSWKPDPGATYVNAFTVSWANRFSHAFPPFSITARVTKKIQEDEGMQLTI